MEEENLLDEPSRCVWRQVLLHLVLAVSRDDNLRRHRTARNLRLFDSLACCLGECSCGTNDGDFMPCHATDA